MKEDWLPSGCRLQVDDGVFPLGQDSILLADFAKPIYNGNMLDLGSGSGVLALSMLGKYKKICVTALERDEKAVQCLHKNREINNLNDRFNIVHSDVNDIKNHITHGSFDYVICNPPYFPQGCGKLHSTLSDARQGDVSDFINATAFALKNGGKCGFIYKSEWLISILGMMQSANLQPKRMRFIQQNSSSAPSAVMIECKKTAKEGLIVMPTMLIKDENGDYTEEYKEIYRDKDTFK